MPQAMTETPADHSNDYSFLLKSLIAIGAASALAIAVYAAAMANTALLAAQMLTTAAVVTSSSAVVASTVAAILLIAALCCCIPWMTCQDDTPRVRIHHNHNAPVYDLHDPYYSYHTPRLFAAQPPPIYPNQRGGVVHFPNGEPRNHHHGHAAPHAPDPFHAPDVGGGTHHSGRRFGPG